MPKKLSCESLIKEYCVNSSIVGVHYIADDRRHWSERWLWLALVTLSWYGSGLLIISAWEAFRYNPISFVVETNYIDWDTRMPAVAICEDANNAMVYNVSDTIWTLDHPADLEDVLQELSYFRGNLFYTLDFCYKTKVHPLCPITNISYYAHLVRSNCPQIMSKCAYNGKAFDCCEYFQKIPTDMGECYVLNSIQTESPKPYPMINNNTSPRGIISLELKLPTKIYTFGEDDVPSVTSSKQIALTANLGYRYKRHLTVRNMENDPLLIETSPWQRACHFNYENEDGLYPHYSYSACTVLCRKRIVREMCRCNDHFTPGVAPEEHCNMSGLACMVQHYNELSTLKPRWASRPGLVCNCLPSCTETEVTVVKDEITSDRKNKKKSVVKIKLAYLPTEKFKRNVVRSRLDLVVSVGGTTGLFVGASLLSFVELIVYLTIRFVSDRWRKKKRTLRNISKDQFVLGNLKKPKLPPVNIGPYDGSGVVDSKLIYDNYLTKNVKWNY